MKVKCKRRGVGGGFRDGVSYTIMEDGRGLAMWIAPRRLPFAEAWNPGTPIVVGKLSAGGLSAFSKEAISQRRGVSSPSFWLTADRFLANSFPADSFFIIQFGGYEHATRR
jgi:hypothetical protein